MQQNAVSSQREEREEALSMSRRLEDAVKRAHTRQEHAHEELASCEQQIDELKAYNQELERALGVAGKGALQLRELRNEAMEHAVLHTAHRQGMEQAHMHEVVPEWARSAMAMDTRANPNVWARTSLPEYGLKHDAVLSAVSSLHSPVWGTTRLK